MAQKRPANRVFDGTVALDLGEERPVPKSPNLYSKHDQLPENLRCTLKIEAGPRAPGVYRIEKPVTVLGRGANIADVDVGDTCASRRHASIEYRDGDFWLSDLGSTNGTVLNGKLVSTARLANGDQIQIGVAVLRFERV